MWIKGQLDVNSQKRPVHVRRNLQVRATKESETQTHHFNHPIDGRLDVYFNRDFVGEGHNLFDGDLFDHFHCARHHTVARYLFCYLWLGFRFRLRFRFRFRRKSPWSLSTVHVTTRSHRVWSRYLFCYLLLLMTVTCRIHVWHDSCKCVTWLKMAPLICAWHDSQMANMLGTWLKYIHICMCVIWLKICVACCIYMRHCSCTHVRDITCKLHWNGRAFSYMCMPWLENSMYLCDMTRKSKHRHVCDVTQFWRWNGGALS